MEILSEVPTYRCFIKYAKEYPYLPVAIGDTKEELARRLGISANTVYSSFSKGYETFKEVDYKPDIYPDNDGGCWYYHPITGEVILVKD